MKILIAVDGSSYSKAAARYVAGHLEAFNEPAEVVLLHVHLKIPYPIASTVVGRKAVDDYIRDTSREALKGAGRELDRAGVEYKSTWCVGDVAEEVEKFVRANRIDLVVCGSHGHNAFVNLAMGSVATKLVATLSVPVLLVTRKAAASMNRVKKAA
jgi:nucleotide-binding universal stress UspA family protein